MRTGGHGPRSSTLRNAMKEYEASLREQRKEAWFKSHTSRDGSGRRADIVKVAQIFACPKLRKWKQEETTMRFSRRTTLSLAAAFAFGISVTGSAEAAGKIRIAMLVKSLGNGFFDAAHQGGDEAAKQ